MRTDFASRIVSASPSEVYGAFLNERDVEAWLPPDGMTGRIESFDARPGGPFRMTLTYQGESGRPAGKTAPDADVVKGEFVDLVPNKRVVQRFEFEADDPAFAGAMTMTWTFEAKETGGTKVSILCENVPDGISKEDHDAGLRSTLANLAAFVERSDVRSFDRGPLAGTARRL